MATAKKHKCDLIVMASHGRKGFKRILLGSETQHVLTHSSRAGAGVTLTRFAQESTNEDIVGRRRQQVHQEGRGVPGHP